MIRVLAMLAWVLTAGAVTSVQAQPAGVTPADRAAIEQVIRGQIEAFRADDAPAAYAFAAPSIKRMFPDPETFMGMVRTGYPPVYRPRGIDFGELGFRDGELVQPVELIGPDGRPALALYTMERGADGTWAISGCSIVASARLGV